MVARKMGNTITGMTMDNNNFNGQMNGQIRPNGQQVPNMGQNMGQPYPPQMPLQMMHPPKQPMDPKKKKTIILTISIASGVVVLGIIIAIVLLMILKVNYSTAYKTAKELKPYIYDIHQDYDCGYVVEDVDSSYVSDKDYSGWINACQEVYDSEINDLVSQLENTDGVRRNEEIKTQFNKFKTEYIALSDGDAAELAYKMSL